MKQTGVNNLSQQLCELCGIEPKILYKSKSNLSSGTCWKTREEYKNSACNQSWSETENTRYPDFEKPENFVKLEEIMLKELAKERLTVVKWVHEWSDSILMHEYIMITKCGHKFQFKHKDLYIDNWFVERENRTDCLILFILWKVMPICGEAIKQAIAAEEWEY